MTPHFTEAIRGITSEIYLKSCCDVLLNIPNNGPRGFGAIVKSCFISEDPDTIEYCLNNKQGTEIGSGSFMGSEIEENRFNIGHKGYVQEGREDGGVRQPHPLRPGTIKETVIDSFFTLTGCTPVSGYIAP